MLDALHLSRATFSKIQQNLCWAFAYNLVGIPLAAGALLPTANIALTPSIAGMPYNDHGDAALQLSVWTRLLIATIAALMQAHSWVFLPWRSWQTPCCCKGHHRLQQVLCLRSSQLSRQAPPPCNRILPCMAVEAEVGLPRRRKWLFRCVRDVASAPAHIWVSHLITFVNTCD